jgi:hypothetical protein
MSYGFRAGGQARTRRQPKMDDDNIGTALRRSLTGGEPRRASSQRGSTPRTGLPTQLNQRMPVNLSNGEFEFTPEQIYAIGLQAVAAMRHGDGRPGFADGPGAISSLGPAIGSVLKGVGGLVGARTDLNNGELLPAVSDAVSGANAMYDASKGVLGDNATSEFKKFGAIPKVLGAATSGAKALNNYQNGQYWKSADDAASAVSNLSDAASSWIGDGGTGGFSKAKSLIDKGKGASQFAHGIQMIRNGDTSDGIGSMFDGIENIGPKENPWLNILRGGHGYFKGINDVNSGEYGKAFQDFGSGVKPAFLASEALVPEGMAIGGGLAGTVPASVVAGATLASGLAGAGLGYGLYRFTPYGDMINGEIDTLKENIGNRLGVLSDRQKQQVMQRYGNQKIIDHSSLSKSGTQSSPPVLSYDAIPDTEANASQGRKLGNWFGNASNLFMTPANKTDAYMNAEKQYINELNEKGLPGQVKKSAS